jgi:hypothetical protein
VVKRRKTDSEKVGRGGRKRKVVYEEKRMRENEVERQQGESKRRARETNEGNRVGEENWVGKTERTAEINVV